MSDIAEKIEADTERETRERKELIVFHHVIYLAGKISAFVLTCREM